MSKIQKSGKEYLRNILKIQKKRINTKRKVGKTAYKVVVHFNENETATMQDKLTRIMPRELRKNRMRKDDFD
ncbi:MAG: hypothetical protein Q4D77_08070 [Peptostreptococcaceae bacterium]|nr:hypothetical protein [Peptostreptococcaceae bacterium]